MELDPITFFKSIFSRSGFSSALSVLNTQGGFLLIIIISALLVWLITEKIVYKLIRKLASKTKNTWDDQLVQRKFFTRLFWLAPAGTIQALANTFFMESIRLKMFLIKSAELLIILSITLAILDLLSFANTIYNRRPDSKKRPIKGIIQAVQVVLIATGVLSAFSILTGKPVTGLMAGLGALSAVLMLIFQDPLTGLVAGFQISSNDMVRIGDWITVPAHGADGDVIDINLLTVSVQNWDKTIVTIPIKALTTGSFKNWRGMSESGGRRIKRSIAIDISSIHFINDTELQRFKNITLLKDFIENREKEISQYNSNTESDREASPVNGRAMTNIGIFRAYAQAYISAHPQINKKMTLMVRQLQSGSEGLPLEIYAFSSDQVWANYESIQADIFDHLLAALPEFNLRAFQQPTGNDIANIIKSSEN
ncbi:MAG: mechanosensitive ion channel [Spirochaetales bacterium]|nr:mechanosensitive ion channel [Spirochaetales bacterium]